MRPNLKSFAETDPVKNVGVTSRFLNVLDKCQFLMDSVALNGCVNQFDHLKEADEVLMLGRNTVFVLRLLRWKVSVIRFCKIKQQTLESQKRNTTILCI
jgi:hypothetical protein